MKSRNFPLSVPDRQNHNSIQNASLHDDDNVHLVKCPNLYICTYIGNKLHVHLPIHSHSLTAVKLQLIENQTKPNHPTEYTYFTNPGYRSRNAPVHIVFLPIANKNNN